MVYQKSFGSVLEVTLNTTITAGLISRNQELFDLTTTLLDPSEPHFSMTSDVLSGADDLIDKFSHTNWDMESRFWNIEWTRAIKHPGAGIY